MKARAVKVAEGNLTEAPNYSFVRADAKSTHGSQPVKTVYEVLIIEGSPYQKIVAEDGHSLSALRAHEEEQKFHRERANREKESAHERHRRIEKYTEDRNRDHAMLTELCDAFDYTVTGEQQIGENSVWRFSADKTPYKTHTAAVLPRRGREKHASAGFYCGVSLDEIEGAGAIYMPRPQEVRAIRT